MATLVDVAALLNCLGERLPSSYIRCMASVAGELGPCCKKAREHLPSKTYCAIKKKENSKEP